MDASVVTLNGSEKSAVRRTGALVAAALRLLNALRRSAVMAKAASGALDLVPLIEVRNLGDALVTLKGRGLRAIGFDSEAPAPLAPRAGGEAVAIVLGAEGKGLRQRTRELCDELVRLDMPGPIKSLNVSNAAAIALFAVTAGRK